MCGSYVSDDACVCNQGNSDHVVDKMNILWARALVWRLGK